MRPRDWVALALISICVSTCGVYGCSYTFGKGWPILYPATEVALCILFTPIVAILLLAIETLFFRNALIQEQAASFIGPPTPTLKTRIRHICNLLTPRWSAQDITVFSLAMAILWLPWFIANFPGGTYWDTYYQMFQVYPENHPIAIIPWAEIYDQTLTDAWLVDHHPIFTTLVYGAFGWVSDQLTGNWMTGVAIFCILQGLAHNVAFSASVAYMRKVGCPPLINLIAYAFFAIMPFISTWALCMVKDSFFGLFMVPYFMLLFETVRTNGECMGRPRNRILFALCALMLCLTKKTGIFVVVATAIVGIVAFAIKRSGKTVIAFIEQALLCTLVMMLVFPYLLFPALNIQPGGLQETLGPLFQQTARYVHDYPDDVTISERNAITAVIDYEKLADQYAFDFEDSVKYRYNLYSTPEELKEYFKTYLAQGMRHPDAYFAAITSLAGFYVAPTAYINIRMVTVDTKMGPDDRYMLWNPDELDWLRNGLDDAYSQVASIPGLNLPLLIVTYAFWLPAILAYVAWRNRLHSLTLFIPALVLLGFCIIAPVYDARYVVPILDAAPLFLGAIIVLIQQCARR